jgi:NTE family protein
VALSGGGQRAAGFGYGVLLALEQEGFGSNVFALSVVSGGAFAGTFWATASQQERADREEFIRRFLEPDLEARFSWVIPRPSGIRGSARFAAKTYASLFGGKRFRDLRADGPLLLVNATELTSKRRFTFSRSDMACLGSDFYDFPLGYAVAASSAFPGAYAPLRLKNYGPLKGECPSEDDLDVKAGSDAASRGGGSEGAVVVDPFDTASDFDRSTRQQFRSVTVQPTAILADGGLSDNLGVHALVNGRVAERWMGELQNPERSIVILVVDSGNRNDLKDRETPDLVDILLRMGDVMVDRGSEASIGELNQFLDRLDIRLRSLELPLGRVACIRLSMTDLTALASKRADVLATATTLAGMARDLSRDLIQAGSDVMKTRMSTLQALRDRRWEDASSASRCQ